MRTLCLATLSLISITLLSGCATRDDVLDRYNEFAIQMAEAGLWREAAFRWEKIIDADPDNAKAHNNLGVAYEALGRYEEAAREYEIAIEMEPQNKFFQRNYIRFKKGQLGQNRAGHDSGGEQE